MENYFFQIFGFQNFTFQIIRENVLWWNELVGPENRKFSIFISFLCFLFPFQRPKSHIILIFADFWLGCI